MNINELSLSVPATFSRLLSCRAGADQLLTSDMNPSKFTWCLTSTETIRLIRDGEKGGGIWRWGKRETIYLSLHCHYQNDSCIKMGSDESHFNVSLSRK